MNGMHCRKRCWSNMMMDYWLWHSITRSRMMHYRFGRWAMSWYVTEHKMMSFMVSWMDWVMNDGFRYSISWGRMMNDWFRYSISRSRMRDYRFGHTIMRTRSMGDWMNRSRSMVNWMKRSRSMVLSMM